jgi:hypothetical protein
MRITRSVLHRRGAALAIGMIAAAGLTAGTTAPAFAGTGGGDRAVVAGTGSASAAVSAPSATAPVSGRSVSGAVYGTAAVTQAGTAAGDFRDSHKNMVASLKAAGAVTPAASQLHDWWGTFPNTNSGAGGMATQSVDPNFRLSNKNDVLYAPTMTPANGSCIEVVTVHTTSTPQIWAWDWCNSIAPGAEVTVNSAFVAKYTTTVNGRTVYTQKNVQTNKSSNTWTSYLYDYETKAWDTLFTSSGTDQSGLSYGWDMFEFYSSTNPSTGDTYVCDDIAKAGLVVESSSVEIETAANTWTLANASNSTWMPSASPNPTSYKCPKMVFTIVTNNSDWTVSES